MRALCSMAVVAAAIFLGAAPTHAAGGPPSSVPGRALGLVPVHSRGAGPDMQGAQNGAVPGSGFGSLQYHSGGKVQTGTHNTYAIYWGTSFSSSYSTLINGFFTNVAADNGKPSNVYYSDTQYYQTINNVKNYVTYSEHFAGSWADSANPTTHNCSNTDGGTVACVTDADVQAEVSKAMAANSWTAGQGNEYFVFLGNGISTCTDSSGSECAFSYFCAYHSSFSTGSGPVLYANMPYTGYNLS